MESKEAENSSQTPDQPQRLGGTSGDTIDSSDIQEGDMYVSGMKNMNKSPENDYHATSDLDQIDLDQSALDRSALDQCAFEQLFADLKRRLYGEGGDSSQFSKQCDVDASLIWKCIENFAPAGENEIPEHLLLVEIHRRYLAGVVTDASRRRIKALLLLIEIRGFVAMTTNERLEYLKGPRDVASTNGSSAREFEKWNGPSGIQNQESEDPDDTRVLARGIVSYSQLSKDALEIRLLELLPGSQNDPIECTLSTTTLKDETWFEALSYTWGDPQGPRGFISIDRVQISVSQNLFDALFHLRNDIESRTLWIDAVCINQTDLLEKNHQVQLMARIYSSAHRVIIWLGLEEDDSGFFMDTLQQLAERKIDSNAEVLRSERFWRSFKAFTDRPWWWRVWVVQEAAMAANDPLIYCGFSTLSWKLLQPDILRARCSNLAINHGENLQDGMNNLQKITIWTFFASIREGGIDTFRELSRSLYSCFTHTREHQATDPRDKIFAFFGFFDSIHQSLLIPDYTLSTEFVFILAATVMVIFDRNLDYFENCSIAENALLPSWVPDLACQKVGSPYVPWLFIYSHADEVSKSKRHSASGNLSPIVHALRFGQLGVEGFQFDTVVEMYEFGNIEHDPSKFCERIRCLEDIAKEAQQKEINLNCATSSFSSLRSKEPIQSFFRPLFSTSNPKNVGAYETKLNNLIILNKAQKQRQQDLGLHGYTDLPSLNALPEDWQKHRRALEMDPMYISLSHLLGRKLFITSLGFTGIGVPTVQKGDLVTILFGFSLPFVIRDHGNYQTFVGAARVSGVMDGELVPFYEEGMFEKRSFVIH